MSYSISLEYQGGDRAVVDLHEEGGTPRFGGSPEAAMDVTYNYSDFFYTTVDECEGIRWMYGKSGFECAERLKKAIWQLGKLQDEDYWKGTPGNAGYALSILLQWAEQHPDAVFRGD